jgi:hypothetical protein
MLVHYAVLEIISSHLLTIHALELTLTYNFGMPRKIVLKCLLSVLYNEKEGIKKNEK